jgi:putative transposase
MHPYPQHLGSFDYVGFHRYFLTFCTRDRRPFFTEPKHVQLVEEYFLRAAKECEIADLAHCFMPDHLHAAVEGRSPAADARIFISRMKQYTGFHFKRKFGEPLWQRYGHERVVRDDEATTAVIRYVLENPLRAGLVVSVGEYPFLGSSEYSIEQLLDFCIDLGNSSG